MSVYVSDVCFYVVLFVFCKQKTAYEVRMSDWSSDVCSSDLRQAGLAAPAGHCARQRGVGHEGRPAAAARRAADGHRRGHGVWLDVLRRRTGLLPARVRQRHWRGGVERSEEHTSELQSLMRISYAVFCLKKKNKPHKQQ